MLDDRILFNLETEINRIYAEVEIELVSAIAQELSRGSSATISPIAWRTEKLRQMGRLEGKLTTILQRKLKTLTPEIEQAVFSAMVSSGDADDAILKQISSIKAQVAAGTFVPTSKSTIFEQLAASAIANAKRGMNLTNTGALQAASQMWASAVNDAYMRTLTGSMSLDQSVKRAVRQLGKQGAYVNYISANGKRTRNTLEVAIRRDVVTSVNQSAAKMTMGRCDEEDLDLVEVSSHAGSRPEHEVWQGKVYSLHGKTQGYELLSIATGYGDADGLCGVNCRHSFYPFHPGLSKQNENDTTKRENEKIYENTQKQRYIERNIRNAKREAAVCGKVGDAEGAQAATQRVRDYQAKMRELIRNTGMTRQYPREQIYT